MNIVFAIGSFYPSQSGGPCNVIYALAKSLVKAGHKVWVITTNFDIPSSFGISFGKWVNIDGIRAYYIQRPKPVDSIWLFNFSLLMRPSLLVNVLREINPDLIHANMLYTILPHISAIYAKEQNIPLLWSPHGSTMPAAYGRSNLKKKVFLFSSLVRCSLAGSHYHVTSEEERGSVLEFFKRYTGEDVSLRTHLLPFLIPDEIFVPASENRSFKDPYILYLGRIHPIKKIENLIKAFAIAKIDNKIKLIIAGDDSKESNYAENLKALVKRLNIHLRVIFTGRRVEGHDKASLYRHAEVFILPSESENFGLTVLESLAQGVPVIASKKTPWRILEEKEAGYWKENDPESLSKAIEHYFSLSDVSRKSIRENAVKLAGTYSESVLVNKYIEMYKDVIKSRKV